MGFLMHVSENIVQLSCLTALYYNKQARQQAIDKILKAVDPLRSGTTSHDVNKKIQVLRTQYGQELTKIKKSEGYGKDYIYQPKIWWFKEMSFLKEFMKSRPAVPVEEIEIHDDEEEEIITQDSAKKRLRLSDSGKITIEDKSGIVWDAEPSPGSTTKNKYVIYEDNSMVETEGQGEIIVEPYTKPTESKRNEEIGKFVAAQMGTIKDDLLFYNTQHEILSIINKAQIKQLEKNLSNSRGVISVALESE